MYIILEFQTTGDKTALCPAVTKTDRLEAEATYHQKLAAAALSSVDIHTVLILNERGQTIMCESYDHLIEH